MKSVFFLTLFLSFGAAISQPYTSYFTGNTVDVVTQPTGGTCMMGGATEHDEAMKWFLQRANGGDILILRTSGSDGYNNYFYSGLGVTVNSVETIVFNNASATNSSYVHNKIINAEAIWFAGGNQWNYISYWRNTPVDSLINNAILNNNIVVGGTSAGMAILGKYYFSAQNGTVTSNTATNNPYASQVTVDSTKFLQIDYLDNVITDTHYDDPDRKGRHIVFLARILTDMGVAAKGIACNEYTSVCIDENGLARVYGDYPNYPETAFFLQTNCELPNYNPENCSPATPLNWNLNGEAIRVYKVNGTNNGVNTFSLNDWETGNGGTWENWYIDNGVLNQVAGQQINCSPLSINENTIYKPKVYPNPFNNIFNIEAENEIINFSLIDVNGRTLLFKEEIHKKRLTINKKTLPKGIYFLKVETTKKVSFYKLLKN